MTMRSARSFVSLYVFLSVLIWTGCDEATPRPPEAHASRSDGVSAPRSPIRRPISPPSRATQTVRLSWNTIEDTDGYIVYRALGAGEFVEIANGLTTNGYKR